MRIQEIITNNISEDASADATSASDVNPGGIAFPLFGPKKAVRRAVDPMGYTKPKKKKNTKPYTNKVKDIYPSK